jgi:hypothetical protein
LIPKGDGLLIMPGGSLTGHNIMIHKYHKLKL